MEEREDDDDLEENVYEPIGNVSESDEDVRISNICLSVRCLYTTMRSNIFTTYIMRGGKSFKVMINGGSCVNIISRTAAEKIPQSYNITWLDKTAYSIT